MPKASLTLPDGTKVAIEGTTEEVHQLLSVYGPADSRVPEKATRKKGAAKRATKKRKAAGNASDRGSPDKPDIAEIVNLIKTCDEAEGIESKILDQSSQVDRVLLPLYIVHEQLENGMGLTSGEIAKITTDLGIPVSQPNASRALSGSASRYVVGDTVRKKGQPVRYKLHRRGVKYLATVVSGGSEGS